jgi:hypothetical protein
MEAERARRAADERRRRQEQMKHEMIQANEYQKQLKVTGRAWQRCWASSIEQFVCSKAGMLSMLSATCSCIAPAWS